jgi:hypothetical protein
MAFLPSYGSIAHVIFTICLKILEFEDGDAFKIHPVYQVRKNKFQKEWCDIASFNDFAIFKRRDSGRVPRLKQA